MVDGAREGYLRTVCDYVHLNPVRAGLLQAQEALSVYRWSSFKDYLLPPNNDRSGSGLSALWGEHGIPQDTEAGRKELGMKMEMRRHEKNEKAWKKIRRGWCVGSAE